MKWKGALFYRFITTLVDEDPEIRKFGLWLFITFKLIRYFLGEKLHFTSLIECLLFAQVAFPSLKPHKPFC